MKRAFVVALSLALMAGALTPAADAAKRKKKKPKSVATALFMHGQSQFGEVDGAQWAADGFGPESPMTLDANKPAAGQPKSMNYFNPLLNDQCTGLPTGFPTFTGKLAGTIVGDAKMTLHFLSAPATIKARIWADIGAFTACNDNYVEPASEVDVNVAPGQSSVEVVFPGLNLPATSSIMIEILAYSGRDYKGQVGRLLYDSASAPSGITFDCIPASGNSCTP